MSYQVLARKWRPQSFKEMVGQEHVLKALIHSLDQQRLHHAYLFTGTRGVGKTTIGRILAKCLNCETSITSVPCGQCDACREITEGRFVDLIEIDAASRTKVEDMRELLENVQYSPTRGRFKVYLIDEVHMLSSSSFNALLKTLEEPPEHVKFLFATTDPQKLPVTILSRCLQFNLKNMPPERIVGHLKNILGQEHIEFEDSALWLLARSADGSMRDALSLTDQAIAYGNHKLAEREVSAMLGSIDQKQVYRIIEAIANLDASSVLQEVASLAEYSPDYSAVLANVISVLHRVAVEQAVPGSTDNSMGDQDQVVELARALSAEDVQLFYQVALVGRSDLPISPDQRAGLEMVLLRMLAFQPNVDKNTPKLQLANSETVRSEQVSSEQVSSEPESSETVSKHSDGSDEEAQNTGSELDSDELGSDELGSDELGLESDTISDGGLEPETVVTPPTDKATDTAAVTSVGDSSSVAELTPSSADNPPPWDTNTPEEMLLSEAPTQVVTEPVNTDVRPEETQAPPEGHPAHDGFDRFTAYDEGFMQAQSVEASDNDLGQPEEAAPETPAQKKTAESELATVDSSSDRASTVSALNQPEAESRSETAQERSVAKVDEVAPDTTDINAFLAMKNPWPHILPLLQLTGMTQNLAANTSLKLEPNRAELCAAEGNFKLLTNTHKSRIVEAFKSVFGDGFMVDFMQGQSEIETPAAWKDRKKEERLALAISSIETDPNVVTLVNRFDATILTSTVEPLD
ncbi:DNA polymerase III subunit gamma/tau [Alkalimarinus sediminis]|uniref:DNA polymerase III subunit gamma/tau n=1 Tax=Alkalimarinus sediminis TaxID=1632866 RepID=A0A9E8HN49_9ALTE|nr:DNA polymerase III subunit gamma/tau [Alkalimarinus sediminis]UZW75991.1 DNA polymerase III subunit gamma/tau [Alkalimarinus sediminis]